MIEWAKSELARIPHDEDGVQNAADKDILELLQVFCDQGHSNLSANYVLNIFDRLAHYLPLTALTGEDEEWNEITPCYFQNKRCGHIFKDGDGRAYNSEGKIFSYDNGETWVLRKDSRVYIEFPYDVPRYPEKVLVSEEPS